MHYCIVLFVCLCVLNDMGSPFHPICLLCTRLHAVFECIVKLMLNGINYLNLDIFQVFFVALCYLIIKSYQTDWLIDWYRQSAFRGNMTGGEWDTWASIYLTEKVKRLDANMPCSQYKRYFNVLGIKQLSHHLNYIPTYIWNGLILRIAFRPTQFLPKQDGLHINN